MFIILLSKLNIEKSNKFKKKFGFFSTESMKSDLRIL